MRGSVNLFSFKQPKNRELKPNTKITLGYMLRGFVNFYHAIYDKPHFYACYSYMRLFHVFSILSATAALCIMYLHFSYRMWPSLTAQSGAENLFELYLYLIAPVGPISLIILGAFLYWLSKNYSFKDYDYFKLKERDKFAPPQFADNWSLRTKLIYFGIGSIFFIAACWYAQYTSNYFFQGLRAKVNTPKVNDPFFILMVACFIELMRNIMMHGLLLGTTCFLSLKHQYFQSLKE